MWLVSLNSVVIYRGGSRTAATSKMVLLAIIVNGFQSLTISTKRSILDVAGVLDPPLISVRITSILNISGTISMTILYSGYMFLPSKQNINVPWIIQALSCHKDYFNRNIYIFFCGTTAEQLIQKSQSAWIQFSRYIEGGIPSMK